MHIKLEANSSGQGDYDELDPELLAVENEKGEKYGFIDAVTDGVQIEVNNIDISLHGPDFDGTVGCCPHSTPQRRTLRLSCSLGYRVPAVTSI